MRSPRAGEGYVLLIMMMIATLLLISLAAAVPSIYVEGQREKEKELIFRGEQYARAIELFHTKFNRYPTSVKELLHTNNMSFLRRAFRDPMSKDGKWRFIHATASGIIIDSKILGPPSKQKKKPGGPQKPGASGSANSETNGKASQSNSKQQSGPGTGSFSLPGLEQNSGQSQQGSNSSNFFGGKKLVGVYIVGVASTSHQQSIGVFDGRTEYDYWEFLGVPGAPGAPKLGGTSIVPTGQQQKGQTPLSGPASQPNSNGGFHLGPSPSSRPGSVPGGNSNP
ncbi:MAG: hypothetical protein P8Z30_03195 [Acidobacteriota bacterium]